MRSSALQAFFGFVIILLVCSVFLFLNTNYGFLKKQNCFQIFAKFDNVSGLSVGSAVKTSGVKIGEVKSISFDDCGRIVVSLCIDNDLKIPEDTSAAILYENFFSGVKFIDLELGQSQDFLMHGGLIFFTQSSLNLENIIRQFIKAKM